MNAVGAGQQGGPCPTWPAHGSSHDPTYPSAGVSRIPRRYLPSPEKRQISQNRKHTASWFITVEVDLACPPSATVLSSPL